MAAPVLTDERRAQVIAKIAKMLALAADTGNAHEAEVAAQQAQKWLADYNLSLADMPAADRQEELLELEADKLGVNIAWKYELLFVIARNMRCEGITYSLWKTVGGVKKPTGSRYVMLGLKTDVTAAIAVYHMAIRAAERCYIRYDVRQAMLHNNPSKNGTEARERRVSYLLGFVEGLRAAYRLQVRQDTSCALMVVMPAEVTDALAVMQWGKAKAASRERAYDQEASRAGYKDGKAFTGQGELR